MTSRELSEVGSSSSEQHQPRQDTRAWLRDRYGIDGEVVRAAALARVLGMTPQSIRRGMQSGQFFLPCTRILSSTVVKVEDLVRWLSRSAPTAQVDKGQPKDSVGDARIKERALVNMRKKQSLLGRTQQD